MICDDIRILNPDVPKKLFSAEQPDHSVFLNRCCCLFRTYLFEDSEIPSPVCAGSIGGYLSFCGLKGKAFCNSSILSRQIKYLAFLFLSLPCDYTIASKVKFVKLNFVEITFILRKSFLHCYNDTRAKSL